MAAAGGGKGGKGGEAGGDGPPNHENPFSFKKFMNKRDPDKSGSDSDSGDGDEVPSEEESTVVEEIKSKKPDDNPFSFKKFLQAGSGGGSTAGRVSISNSPGRIATLDLANDLPDFVQDHYYGDRDSRTRPRNSSTESNLPDFALDTAAAAAATPSRLDDQRTLVFDPSSASGSSKNTDSFGARPKSKINDKNHNIRLFSDLASDFDLDEFQNVDSCTGTAFDSTSDADRRMTAQNNSNSLPDFLSDSAIGVVNHASSRGLMDNQILGIPVGGVGGLENSLRLQENLSETKSLHELQDENRELRRQLNDARVIAQRETKRANDLSMEVEAIRKHETDEMDALEKMVQQVEANLLSTTERAVTAETAVVKLKQEVKTLQTRLHLLQSENEVLHGTSSSPLRERALNASQQIGAAAVEAEKLLKQLLSGVDTLKTVSDILASADRLTDMPYEGNGNSACGSQKPN